MNLSLLVCFLSATSILSDRIDDEHNEYLRRNLDRFLNYQTIHTTRVKDLPAPQYSTQLFQTLQKLGSLKYENFKINRRPYLDFFAYYASRFQNDLTEEEERDLNSTRVSWLNNIPANYGYDLIPVDRNLVTITKESLPYWSIILQSAIDLGVGGYNDTFHVAVHSPSLHWE